ncbi:MAG: ABC transporter permease [Tannerella sp.]|nr:ABC transporter permease [Tannerella sp.]
MLKYLLEKEFKQFFRNSFLPKLVVMFPVMVMLVLPWVTTMDIRDIRLTVVDRDHSSSSGRLIRDIDVSTYFRLENVTDNHDAAISDVEYGVADIVLEIPSGFEKDLLTAGTAPVQVLMNAVNGTKGILGGSYLGRILADFSQTFARDKGYAPVSNAASAAIPKITLLTQNRYNPHLDYKTNMIPALMVILLIVLCGFLPALNIVSEKERGTIEQINVTPVPKFLFILAKLIPYWLMGFVVLTICMLLAHLVYGLTPAGSIPAIYLFTLLFVLAISGFGLVVSNYAATMQQALFVMFFFVMLFQLMSGLLTPVRSMPEWAQWITVFVPPRYFIHAMRLIYLKGGVFSDLQSDFFALLGFVGFFSSWAVWSYKKV